MSSTSELQSHAASHDASLATMPGDLRGDDSESGVDAALHRRTLRKLDFLLLPFLSLLFLFNSLDKSNVRLPTPGTPPPLQPSLHNPKQTLEPKLIRTWKIDRQCRVRAFHTRHRTRRRRSKHRRSPLLRFLRDAAACRRGARETVWDGGLGAELYVFVGVRYGGACLA